uniref:Translation initiation factor IF-2, chloroplastic n=1 Tax=Bornetia secundiflora TaxID=2575637 RepID=A0A4D6WQ95_9FLOR|nr:Translation initiation factor 2 [Bornetia secundiflora]
MKSNDKTVLYYLKSPKLIKISKIASLIKDNSLVNANNSVIDIATPVVNSNSPYKFDKKHKTNNVGKADLGNTKKNKPKLHKKNRKNLNMNQDDLLHDDSHTLNLTKSISKFNKNRKKDKNKVDYYDESNIQLFQESRKNILITSPLTIQELAYKLNMPGAEIITYLFLKGISATINQVIDVSMAKNIIEHYDFNFLSQEPKSIINHDKEQQDEQNMIRCTFRRSPIITIFGHVDHGKTTLLDAILKTQLVDREYGGITQSLNGYPVTYKYELKDMTLIFLDTPGHEAFSHMRLRGAKVADIALLVIAADDGLKPQTIEAIKCILSMKLSYIVVINKIDKSSANVDTIQEELTKYDIVSEEWGGDAIIIKVSALKGDNIDNLLNSVCLLSELQNLSSDPDQLAQGMILEAYLDKQKGIIANSLVQKGTLRIGDFLVAGNVSGRVKNIIDTYGNKIKHADPSSIVKILGFSKITEAGISFKVLDNDKDIKQYVREYNSHQSFNNALKLFNNRITANYHDVNMTLKQFNIIIKTDTQGSLEAIINAFSKIPQGKVQINVIKADIGNITRSDIDLAVTSSAIVTGFNIKISSSITTLSKRYSIPIYTCNIIYELLDHITSSMLNLVDPEYEPIIIGQALVQTVFNINKGTVAGCIVNSGKLKKMCNITVYRNNNIVYEGLLSSLKRIKEDVEEVFASNECGVFCDSYHLWQNSDIIKAYQLQAKNKVL